MNVAEIHADLVSIKIEAILHIRIGDAFQLEVINGLKYPVFENLFKGNYCGFYTVADSSKLCTAILNSTLQSIDGFTQFMISIKYLQGLKATKIINAKLPTRRVAPLYRGEAKM